jgi:periplasmic protein TonB
MSNPVIFKELPATFPEEDKHKQPAVIGSIVIHIVLVTILILIPLLMPDRIDYRQLMTLIAPPLAPPAGAQPAPIQVETPLKPPPVIQRIVQVDPGTIIMPTEIPKEIARIVEDAPSPGVRGGLPNGVVGGVIRTILLAGSTTTEVTPPGPPPPPPPPVAKTVTPVRVGGDIREPKVIQIVPPAYPKLAIKARVHGTVILEAILTAEGTVAEIQVISGNPLLTQAAVDCVKQWRYEPTYLNGEPVPVILTARVHFELEHLS